MNNFADRLIAAVRRKRSRVVVGLDPRIDSLPRSFRPRGAGRADVAKAFERFCREIISIVHPYAAAVKPQIAFFEEFGAPGFAAFERVCAAARDRGLAVIADVKRGDIASTAEGYARAFFGGAGASPMADAVTVNPYFGWDGVEPFVRIAGEKGCGVFLLVRTSNPSSAEIQNLPVNVRGRRVPMYEEVARMVSRWGQPFVGRGGYSAVGAVVGATHPSEARRIRKIMPKSFFLVPGYGAQGGTAEDVRVCFRRGGMGAIVNASRSVIFAHRQKPYAEQYGERRWTAAVEAAVIRMRDEINRAIGSFR